MRTRDPAILVGAAGYMLFDVAMLGVCFAVFGNDVPPAGVLLVACSGPSLASREERECTDTSARIGCRNGSQAQQK